MDILYIKAHSNVDGTFGVDLESLEALFVFNLVKSDKIKLKIHIKPNALTNEQIRVDLSCFSYDLIEILSKVTSFCEFPIIVSENEIISGLCSVLRRLIKYSDDAKVRSLLGFREACLLSCAETSVWTHFCEIDIINTTRNVLNLNILNGDILTLPESVLNFEYHLKQPVRTHNVYKLAREKNCDKTIKSNQSLDTLGLNHDFSEGTEPTLADAVLYPCFEIFFTKFPKITDKLPLIDQWYRRVHKIFNDYYITFKQPECEMFYSKVVYPVFAPESLYKSESTKPRSSKRALTKQTLLDELFANLKLPFENKFEFGAKIDFAWSKVPQAADPVSGALPEKRSGRKRHQLESVVRAVGEVVEGRNVEKCRIVDFCSGSGHLGILLAVFMPKCEIVLVENKERSLDRAKARIWELGLKNVVMVQSNLDYFKANFDVGVALHACGSATDLVISKCIYQNADFIICPCCYGSIKNVPPLLDYPLSKKFNIAKLRYENYQTLAHAADQTHDENNAKTTQGFKCMDIIDIDRVWFARESGYEVKLGKLQPQCCSNKNNLIVGVKLFD